MQYPTREAGTSYAIPSSVTNIADYAFAHCTSLTSVTIGSNVTAIREYAFQQCSRLTSVTIPTSVTSIGKYAFCLCTSLTNVTIPGSVTSIGSWAFVDCQNLDLYFQGNAPSPNTASVLTGDRKATVYYLAGTTGWSSRFDGRPAVLWDPQVLTSDASFGVKRNHFGFNITGTNNFTLVVAASTNLASPTWSPLQTITLTNGSAYFSDPQWTSYPSRFYRLNMP
jgi:hypothetical protein